jgi:AraC-like DNA-binding protein
VDLCPAITASALLAGFRALGLDAPQMARAAGLEGQDLEALDAMIPIGALRALWEDALRRAPGEDLFTEVAMAVPFGAFGVVDYLCGTAETVEAGLRALGDHLQAVSVGNRLELSVDPEGAWLRVAAPAHDDPRAAQLGEEFTLAVIVARFRAIAPGFRVESVALRRKAPVGATRHAALFDARVTFEHTESRARLPIQTLEARLRTADPELRRTLAQVAKRLLIGRDDTPELEVAIRGRLRDLLPHGKPDAARMARSLGLSERSLHRRLASLGRSYQGVLDDFRASEAERLLLDGRRPYAEIALALGFADHSSWTRAFRRWKGASPSEWVAGRRAEAAGLGGTGLRAP